MEEEGVPHNRELYALLNVSPDSSDEEIGKAYRQWVLVCHPDKQAPDMKDNATENFLRISEAYQILSDENKRKVYDIYGMEGLAWDSALNTERDKTQEVKEELEKLRKFMEQQKSGYQRCGTIYSTMYMYLTGMAIQSCLPYEISDRSTVWLVGDMAGYGNSGDAAATLAFEHRLSPVTSIDVFGSAGLRRPPLIGVQASKRFSKHVTRTMGLTLGSESAINIGWIKKEEKSSASGHLKVGTAFLEASGKYTRRFSKNSHGMIKGKIGSDALEIEVGGGRKLSESIDFGMSCAIGIRGIIWNLKLNHRGQKFMLPLLIWDQFHPVIATAALMIPTAINYLAKKFIFKRERKNIVKASAKVQESRAAADKAKQLLQNVANRKKKRQLEIGGLVITKALYGSVEALKKRGELLPVVPNEELASQFIDVALPLNFLVSEENRQLKLHEGVKKSGLMGFCDPCPGEPKNLYVEYSYGSNIYQVLVGDNDELLIPQERHRQFIWFNRYRN